MFQQNEIKTVRGRDKERKSHSRYYHWFGLWRDLIAGCRLEVAADYKGRSWLATGSLWRQIIGDLVRFYTTIFISVLYIDWFFLEAFITMVIRCCKYLLLLQNFFFFSVLNWTARTVHGFQTQTVQMRFIRFTLFLQRTVFEGKRTVLMNRLWLIRPDRTVRSRFQNQGCLFCCSVHSYGNKF